MKRVEATLSPAHLEVVVERLKMIGIPGMTLLDLLAVTSQPQEIVHRGVTTKADLVPRVRIDIVLPDEWVAGVVNAIEMSVRRSEAPGGRILICPVDEVIRIRTGETGQDAI